MEFVGYKEKSSTIDFDFTIRILDSSSSSSSQLMEYLTAYGGGKTSKLSPRNQYQRASAKKRRKNTSQTQTVESTILTDDGYRWRKYGQKIIQNNIHPRCYYRCTFHEDDECWAKKWVQQVSNDPPIYRTHYMGHHTCKFPQIIQLPPDTLLAESCHLDSSKSVLLWFEAPTKTENNREMSPQHTSDEAYASGSGTDAAPYSFPSVESPTCSFGIDSGFDYGFLLDDVDSIPFHLL